MRHLLTWSVVAALAVLGLVATVDAMRGDEVRVTPVVRERTTVPGLARQPELAVRQLREAGVSGVLTYADPDCVLHAVSLPELQPVRAPSYEMCRPAVASGGLGAVDGDVVWAGLGYGAAQVVLSEEELGREISRWFGPPGTDENYGFRAVQAVSLGERTVVLADSTYEPRERVLALLEGERAILVQPRWVVREARSLRPSPRGGYFALLGPDGVHLFDRNADPFAFPAAVRSPQAVAWSPDERWTALATGQSVYVFATEPPNAPVIRVPLAVRDLDWGSETPPELAP